MILDKLHRILALLTHQYMLYMRHVLQKKIFLGEKSIFQLLFAEQ